jgi:2-polyprenyl-3-methyl-5-hydroxy-6-metoxy-1,4-benzoquinol methylase
VEGRDRSPAAQPDPGQQIREFIKHVFDQLSGLVVSAMIYLGHHLGLYRALAGNGALTSSELAQRTGLHERWVREWLHGQAAAGLIDYRGDGCFEMSPIAALVLANGESPAFAAGAFSAVPQQVAVLEQLQQAFKTGIGLPYDAFGREGARGVEGMLAPWFRTLLVPMALPRLEGVTAKLDAGAKVADIGCGTGLALIAMATAYPRSEFHGYEISQHALAAAHQNRTRAAVSNVTFHDARMDPLPGDASFDLVTTFDCLHDMTDPGAAMRAIRRAIKPHGTWFIADINCKPTFEENLARNPMAAMMYGFSVLSCMSSALSEPNGAGLGTLGFTEPLARQMTAAAGFTRFQRHDFDNPVNAYYEVRP